jgi:hypothetical protein
MRQVLTLVAIKNILVRSPTDVTNKHGWAHPLQRPMKTICIALYFNTIQIVNVVKLKSANKEFKASFWHTSDCLPQTRTSPNRRESTHRV